MLLATGPAEYVKFIQIVCWIVIPVLISTIGITVYLHYRRKKKDKEQESTEDAFMRAHPEQVGYTNGDGQYILFDHSGLIREYQNRLFYNHARLTALQKDFDMVTTRYAALATYAQTKFITGKKQIMRNAQEQLPQHVQAEVNKITADYEAERQELMASLQQLSHSYKSLEEENRSLQEQITMQTGTDEEKNAIINRWKEEKILLKDKVANQEYLEDLVEEKKAQVIFLQGQLEQRIKNLYQSEHNRLQTVAEMKQLKEANAEDRKEVDSLKDKLMLKQDEADKMQVILCQKEEQLNEKQQTLNAKLDHIASLENTIRETKEQNEQLNTVAADSKNFVGVLQQQLSDERLKTQSLEQKLLFNEQVMRQFYKDLSGYIESMDKKSPVIALRPEYNSNTIEETAIQ